MFGTDGSLFVNDAAGNQILRYNGTTGGFINVFVAAGVDGPDRPSDLLFGGPDGNLYVSSGDSGEVLRYDVTTGGSLGALVSVGSGGLISPRGFEFSDGLVYVADFGGDTVLRYDEATGMFDGVFVTAGNGGLDNSSALTFGPDGNLYVSGDRSDNVLRYDGITGWLSHSVVRYDGATGTPLGTYVSTGSGGLSLPFALAFHGSSLNVTSAGTDQILKYDAANGTSLGVAASTGLDYPRDVLFGTDDLMYVTSGDNDRILRFMVDGTLDSATCPQKKPPCRLSAGRFGKDSQRANRYVAPSNAVLVLLKAEFALVPMA